MGATDATGAAGADFADHVRARQGRLLRVAFLVCGDERDAEDLLLEALVTLARAWARVREDDPDAVVRRSIYREGASAWRPGRRGPAGLDPPRAQAPPGDADDDRSSTRLVVLRALDTLTPRERATLVLRFFEDRSERETAEVLGVGVGRVRSRTREALARLRRALPNLDSDPGGAIDAVRHLLELASEDVVEVDLADRAWHLAATRRRVVRRRVLLGAGGIAAAAALATVVRRGGAEAPERRSVPTPAVDGVLDEQEVGSVQVWMAPSRALEPGLPRYPDAVLLALPDLLGTGEERPRAVLSPDGVPGTSAPVRALLLVHAAGEGYLPVVLVPRESPQHLLVPGMPLGPVDDGTGAATAPAIGPRTIHDDRHRLVVAQPRRVLVLDTRDASVLELPVPDDGLVHAGWATDGRTVVARSPERDWLVDTQTHQVRRPEGPARPDVEDLVTTPGGEILLRSFASSGTLSDTRRIPDAGVETYGDPAADTGSWVGSGVLLGDDLGRATARSQGLLALRDDPTPSPRLLAAPDDPQLVRGAYRPLAWGPHDTLVLESRSTRGGGPPGSRLLAWDVVGGRLWRVGDTEAPDDVAFGFTGRFAI